MIFAIGMGHVKDLPVIHMIAVASSKRGRYRSNNFVIDVREDAYYV
jgi:hypothetical protein